jgi:hypothetical protein
VDAQNPPGFGAFGIGGRAHWVFYARQRRASRGKKTRGSGIGGRAACMYIHVYDDNIIN